MNLFELSAVLRMDTSQYEKSLGNAEKQGNGFLKKVGNLVDNVGRRWATMQLSAQAVKSFFQPLTNAVKSATSNFADYEQLVGGVETLFKDSAHRVRLYAQDAYKTAGMSANQYMDMVTSFSASMIQSLGGDTEKAAEMSNMAITDMADNANKMGTDMESVQNAYRGFSKQNFTMLDNLKLGYGGTKKEMERLLADAEKLSGTHYDISSFSDIVQAIHVVQMEMDITGTTADEAKRTISGSLGMVKASWQNVITAMAGTGSSRNFNNIINQFTDSLETFIGNVTPAVQRAVAGFKTVVERLAPVIAETLPDLVETLLPDLIDTGFSVATSIFSGIIKLFSGNKLSTMLKKITGNVKKSLLKLLNIPQWIGQENRAASWGDIGRKIVEKISDSLKDGFNKLKIHLGQKLGITDEQGNLLEGDGQARWTEIGRAAVSRVWNGAKNWVAAEKIRLGAKLGLCDADGNPTNGDDAISWADIGGAVLTKIWEGAKNWARGEKLKLGQKLGLCNEDGTLTEGEGEISWSGIGREVLRRVWDGASNWTGKRQISLGEKLGLCDSSGQMKDGTGEISWADIGREVLQRIYNGASNWFTAQKISLGTKLGLCDANGKVLDGKGQVSWGKIGHEILNRIWNGLKSWSTDVKFSLGEKLGLSDSNGNLPEGKGQVSWLKIGKTILDKIHEGLTKWTTAQKIHLGERLGLCDTNGELLTGEGEVSWGDIGGKIMSAIKTGAREWSDTTKVNLGVRLGLCDAQGNLLEGEGEVNWADIGGQILTNIKGGFSTWQENAKNRLGYYLGICDQNGSLKDGEGEATWGNIGGEILRRMFDAFSSGGGFIKRILGGYTEEAWEALTPEEKTWSAIVNKIFTGIEEELGDRNILDLLFEHASDKMTGIATFIGNLVTYFTEWFSDDKNKEAIADFLSAMITGMVNSVTLVIDTIAGLLDDTDFIANLATGVATILTAVANALPSIISSLAQVLIDVIKNPQFQASVKDLIHSVITILGTLWEELMTMDLSEFPLLAALRDILGAFGDLVSATMGLFFTKDDAGNYQMQEWLVDLLAVIKTTLQGIAGVVEVIGGILGQKYNKELNDFLGTIGYDTNDVPQMVKRAFAGFFNPSSPENVAWGRMTTEQQRAALGMGLGMVFGTYTPPAQQGQDNADAADGTDRGPAGQPPADGQGAQNPMVGLLNPDIANLSYRDAETNQMGTVGVAVSAGESAHAWENLVEFLSSQSRLGRWLTEAEVRNLFGTGVKLGDSNLYSNDVVVDGNDILINGEVKFTFTQTDGGEYQFSAAQSTNAKGLWSVPYDDYTARLHRDEMVLTASRARDYRDGMMGDGTAIVAAIEGLRNDMQNLKLVVGRKVFGQATVDYGGRRMQGYIGQAENRAIAGYGWG